MRRGYHKNRIVNFAAFPADQWRLGQDVACVPYCEPAQAGLASDRLRCVHHVRIQFVGQSAANHPKIHARAKPNVFRGIHGGCTGRPCVGIARDAHARFDAPEVGFWNKLRSIRYVAAKNLGQSLRRDPISQRLQAYGIRLRFRQPHLIPKVAVARCSGSESGHDFFFRARLSAFTQQKRRCRE